MVNENVKKKRKWTLKLLALFSKIVNEVIKLDWL